MTPELIDTDAALADLCRALDRAPALVLDTEFLRERTYRARLCLVQVAAADQLALIDPLALTDPAPLWALLGDTARGKVLHAARQDLEVFHDLSGQVPAPVFDTQVAAALLGFDDQIGYAALVQALLGVALDKTHTRTDWSARPLSAAQLQYAADDVRYLVPVHALLHERLAQRGRLAWAEAECARLTAPALYAADPDQAWRRLRGGGDLPPARQQVLRALAAWREREAQTRDRPRGWILRDEVLYELARRAPQTPQALTAIAGLEDGARRRCGEALLATIDQGLHAEPVAVWTHQPPLERAQSELARRLMARVRELATAHEIAPALLATRRDIERLVRGTGPADLWSGWRAELLAPLLVELPPLAPATGVV
jgi:ribonuclease D